MSATNILKQTAVTQAWSLFILNATGETPLLRSEKGSVLIDWKPGQAERFTAYLESSFKEPSGKSDINVTVNWKPVLIPLTVKKASLPVLGYTGLIAILSKIFWK
jgi:hypothetical protein